jgi:hypothetical protein
MLQKFLNQVPYFVLLLVYTSITRICTSLWNFIISEQVNGFLFGEPQLSFVKGVALVTMVILLLFIVKTETK